MVVFAFRDCNSSITERCPTETSSKQGICRIYLLNCAKEGTWKIGTRKNSSEIFFSESSIFLKKSPNSTSNRTSKSPVFLQIRKKNETRFWVRPWCCLLWVLPCADLLFLRFPKLNSSSSSSSSQTSCIAVTESPFWKGPSQGVTDRYFVSGYWTFCPVLWLFGRVK